MLKVLMIKKKEVLQTWGLPAWQAASIISDASSKTKVSFLGAVLVSEVPATPYGSPV